MDYKICSAAYNFYAGMPAVKLLLRKILFEFQQIQESLIDIFFLLSYISKTYHFSREYYPYALVAQSVEHIVGNDEVSGPIPLGSYKIRKTEEQILWQARKSQP